MHLIAVNNFAVQLLGYQRKKELLEQKSFKELLPVKARMFFEISHWPSLRLNGSIREMSYRLEHAKGAEIPVLINSESIIEPKSGKVHYQHLIYPIQRRYTYEQALLVAKKGLEQKLAGRDQQLSSIIHELRSPLHGLMNLVELLGQDQSNAERDKLISVMSSTGRHMTQLVSNLLDWSRLEASGTLKLQATSFNLKENLDDLVTLFEIQALSKGVLLKSSYDTALPALVYGDQNRLNQLLHNLLSNAIKFTDTGSVTLGITSGSSPRNILFTVSDTGRGIAPEDIARILQPFGQLDDQQDKMGSSGLGLSITQSIVKAFGSELKIDSEPGRGANFSFELLLPSPSTIKSEEEKGSIASLDKMSVLAADDVAVNRLILKHHLEKIGLNRAVIVADGSAVIETLQIDTDFQLIFLDLDMPKLNGFETVRQIRKEWPELNIPIVALTAYSKEEVSNEEAHSLFDAVLTKPFTVEVLRSFLSDVSSNKALAAVAMPMEKTAEFSLDQLNELFDDDPVAKAEFIQIFLGTLAEVNVSLSEAGETHDSKAYGFGQHKITTMVQLFGASRVGEVLSQAKSALTGGEFDKFNTLEQERKTLFAAWEKFVSSID